MPRHSSRQGDFPLFLAATALTALGLGLLMARSVPGPDRIGYRPPDSAPGRTARRALFGDRWVSGQTVTIARPRAEVFAFWHDFANLARVMEGVESVARNDDGSWDWVLSGPMGTRFTLQSHIVHEREGEILAWQSTEASGLVGEGKFEFRDAPDNRSTEVTAVVSWRPPAGRMGQAVATLFRVDPAIRARHELKRVKMLLETGEIATARNRKEPV